MNGRRTFCTRRDVCDALRISLGHVARTLKGPVIMSSTHSMHRRNHAGMRDKMTASSKYVHATRAVPQRELVLVLVSERLARGAGGGVDEEEQEEICDVVGKRLEVMSCVRICWRIWRGGEGGTFHCLACSSRAQFRQRHA